MLYTLLRLQAAYYVITGAWPLLSLSSFEAVTGPKVDEWLVHMVGLLAATIGVTLWTGARSKRPDDSMILLSILSATSFAFIDVRYVSVGRISPIYLADAIVEVLLAALVMIAWRRSRD